MIRTEELLALCNDAETVLGFDASIVKQLVELVRLQHDAMLWPHDSAAFNKAIAAFNKFEGGE